MSIVLILAVMKVLKITPSRGWHTLSMPGPKEGTALSDNLCYYGTFWAFLLPKHITNLNVFDIYSSSRHRILYK